MDNKHLASQLMLAGYIRNIQKALSPPLNIIPQEILSIIFDYSTQSCDGEYEWNIDQTLMNKMFQCGSKDHFVSPQFPIGGMEWHLYAYPNGSNRHDKGIFKLCLEPVSMPAKWHQLSIFSRYTCVQNQSSDASIFTFKRNKSHRFYGTESWHKQYSGDPGTISLDDIKQRNTQQLTITIRIKILQIFSTQNAILYQTQLKTQTSFEWNINPKLLKEISYSNSYPMKCFLPKQILNEMWCLKLFPQSSTNTICIGLQLCALPSNIDSIRVEWRVTIGNVQFTSTQKNFDYKSSFDCLRTHLSYTNNTYSTIQCFINIIGQKKSQLMIDTSSRTLEMSDEMTNIYTINVEPVSNVRKRKWNENCQVLRKKMETIAMKYQTFTLGSFPKMYSDIFGGKINGKAFGSLKNVILHFSDLFVMTYERSANTWHITSKVAVKESVLETNAAKNKLKMNKLTSTKTIENVSKEANALRKSKEIDEIYIQSLKQEILALKQKMQTQNAILNTHISKMRQEISNKDAEISKMHGQINTLTLAQNRYYNCEERNNDLNRPNNFNEYSYSSHKRSPYYSYPQRGYD